MMRVEVIDAVKADTIKKIDSILASLKGTLATDFSDDEAVDFVEWIGKLASDTTKDRKEKQILSQIKSCDDEDVKKKLKLKKQKYLPKNYPYNLVIGDIVHVNFGFGYCSEISDGHYGIILSGLIANMYFIMPLSSIPLKSHTFFFDDLNLPSRHGSSVGKKSYLRFDQMGNFHYRRLENISGFKRINIGNDRVGEIFSEIQKHLEIPVDKA